MSRIRANTITNLTIDGPPTVSTGLQVTGVTTSTSFTATTSTLVGSAVTTDSQGVRVAGIVTATTLKYGSTSVETAIAAKASTGKAIAMAMVFG